MPALKSCAPPATDATDALVEELRLEQYLTKIECAGDPEHFIESFLRIEDRSGRAIPFTLWPGQREALEAFHSDGQVVVLKARQLGLSWLALAYALWLAVFQQGSRIVILNKKDTDAKELLARIRRMIERIESEPSTAFLTAHLDKGREAAEQLQIGRSVIRSVVGKPDAIRGEAAALVILDEFAFATEAGKIWRATLPATDRLICISTGNGSSQAGGQGAEFAHQYERADAGQSGFRSMFFPWDVHPE
ncbi:MAG TPA: terminase family protein, partial [Gemmatimonadales bacterium]|nr:terminase family protein [Gemmatimonadales bacterium]